METIHSTILAINGRYPCEPMNRIGLIEEKQKNLIFSLKTLVTHLLPTTLRNRKGKTTAAVSMRRKNV
jgi:hypothetical protein